MICISKYITNFWTSVYIINNGRYIGILVLMFLIFTSALNSLFLSTNSALAIRYHDNLYRFLISHLDTVNRVLLACLLMLANFAINAKS